MVTAGSQWSSIGVLWNPGAVPSWLCWPRGQLLIEPGHSDPSLGLSRRSGQCKWGAASGRRGCWTLSMRNQSEARAGRDQPIEGAA